MIDIGIYLLTCMIQMFHTSKRYISFIYKKYMHTYLYDIYSAYKYVCFNFRVNNVYIDFIYMKVNSKN